MQTYWANVTLDNARFWLPHLQNGNTERLHDTKHFVFRHDAHAVGLIHWSHQWERLFCCSLRKVIKVSSQNGFKWVFASKNIPVNFQSINLSKAWPTEIKFPGRIWIQTEFTFVCVWSTQMQTDYSTRANTWGASIKPKWWQGQLQLLYLPEVEMSLTLEKSSVYKSPIKEVPHHYALHSHGCPEEEARGIAHTRCYAANL